MQNLKTTIIWRAYRPAAHSALAKALFRLRHKVASSGRSLYRA